MNINDIIENAQLKGRIIALDAQVETLTAEVRCLEAVIRSHERVDCLSVTSLKKQLVEAEAENARLKAEVERLTERLGGVRLIVTEEMYDELNTKYLEQQHELQNIALTARQILDEKIDLKEQVERLTKAVMHSPAAQLKLKELEGKTTFDEINPDNQ
jgi:regulator of replication initiation timing